MEPITYAYLETTNHCNLKCSFCNREEVIGALNHMPLKKWGKLLNQIKHHPIEEAKLMGMGEPMLHPQFDDVARMFKETFPKSFVIVATNCQYPIKKNSRMGKRFENSLKYLDMLYLSIDGYKEHYERDRAPAKWDRLITFLEDLQHINRGNCEIVVNYVVNKYNVDDIPKIEKLMEKYNLQTLRLNIAQIWDPDKKIEDEDEIWGYSSDQLDYLKKNYKDKIKGRSPWDWKDCFWVKKGLYTTVEGHVKVCCMNTAAEPLGNLFLEDIDDIRASEDYQKIAKGCSSGSPTDHCKNCSYKELSPLLQILDVNN